VQHAPREVVALGNARSIFKEVTDANIAKETRTHTRVLKKARATKLGQIVSTHRFVGRLNLRQEVFSGKDLKAFGNDIVASGRHVYQSGSVVLAVL
jgi:hypothetical protein